MDYTESLRDFVSGLQAYNEEIKTADDKLPESDEDMDDETLPSADDEDDNNDTDEPSNEGEADTDEELPSADSTDDTDTSDSMGSDDDSQLPSADDADGGESGSDDDGEQLPSADDDNGDSGDEVGGEGKEELPSADDGSEGGDAEGEENPDGEEAGEGEEEDSNVEKDDAIEKIKQIEEELFSNLTDEQMAIKNAELKGQFVTLYSTIGSTLVRINDIPKSEENVNVLKFITDKLLELRDMIDYNITKAYKTRTYIENSVLYQQCIATLNAISDIISDIPNITPEPNAPDDGDEEEDDKGVPIDDTKDKNGTQDISDISVSDYREESVDYNSLF